MKMNTIPRLTIGLPVYNGEKYLGESLEALLGQSYEDFELIITDNASTDGTGDICRRYEKQDSRIRCVRQLRNIGCAPNHNFVVWQARGELFKWASHDDLYARNMLAGCVDALDEYPHVVLANSWTAMIDYSGNVIKAVDYGPATSSLRTPERFRSMMFDGWFDDIGGVIRTEVLRRTSLLGSYHLADRALTTEIGLHGPFYQVPDWLYFRRDHPSRAERAYPSVRNWCVNLDPRRASRLRHPTVRLYSEYAWAYVAAIRRAPMSPAERRECYGYLARWMAGRALPVARQAALWRAARTGEAPASAVQPLISVPALVAGQERGSS
jgi:glycosyltransferase involved in cell wall biosynthesis